MRKAGVSESVTMGITGYSTREIFDRYNRVDMEDKKDAVKRLERYLKGGGQENLSNPLAEVGVAQQRQAGVTEWDI